MVCSNSFFTNIKTLAAYSVALLNGEVIDVTLARTLKIFENMILHVFVFVFLGN